MDNIPFWEQIVTNIGFPIGVTPYLLLPFEKKIDILSETIKKWIEIQIRYIRRTIMSKTWKELIQQAKQNNPEAMLEMIYRFEPKIKKTLYQTNVQNREDLKQELIVKFIEVVHMFELEGQSEGMRA
ncbi:MULTISPECIES: helix-turn-helix domain-containing protein [Paenibacillus]|uniref:helix-turn-helix domain-containing protein n=1 Tax=Paenibacillus TaxID=44249 RepID=UPI0007FBCC90|nr:helix-turn-helix domain-containing protein [Paenibacillus sp. AD87]OAX50804.1 Sigma-O factor regulatory protein RsoA [Paenibacillus sp. AD87]